MAIQCPLLSPALRGLQDAVKIMAKDLVRTRRYVKKFITMRANVQAVSLKIQTLKSNNSMAQAMKGVTKAMATMNRQVGTHGDVPKAVAALEMLHGVVPKVMGTLRCSVGMSPRLWQLLRCSVGMSPRLWPL